MNKPVSIYTDASTTDAWLAGMAMVIVGSNSLVEKTEAVGGFSNDRVELWAVTWALSYAAKHELDAAVYTDAIAIPGLWQKYIYAPPVGPLADPFRKLATLAQSHPHLEVHFTKRGTSIFNRRCDHLAGMALRRSKQLDLGSFLSMSEIHQACTTAQRKQAAR